MSSRLVCRILLYDARVRRRQRGYQLEVLIIVAVVAVALAVGLPKLPPLGKKIAAVAGAIVFIAGFYYDIVVPGWRPGTRLAPPLSWVVFGLVAALIACAAGAFVIYG